MIGAFAHISEVSIGISYWQKDKTLQRHSGNDKTNDKNDGSVCSEEK